MAERRYRLWASLAWLDWGVPSKPVGGKYTVRVEDRVVEAWSTIRLPFQPRDWLRDLRSELQATLRTLVAGPGEVLHAVYSAARGAPCDVENVLFYNVGTAALRRAMTTGVRFERSYSLLAPPVVLETSDRLHHHRYTLARSGEGFAHWTPGAELFRFHRVHVSSLMSVDQIWLAMRRQAELPKATQAPSHRFGLRLDVAMPARRVQPR